MELLIFFKIFCKDPSIGVLDQDTHPLKTPYLPHTYTYKTENCTMHSQVDLKEKSKIGRPIERISNFYEIFEWSFSL